MHPTCRDSRSRSSPIVDDPIFNPRFLDVLQMSKAELVQWTDRTVAGFLRLWNQYGRPPTAIRSDKEIDDELSQMRHFDVLRELQCVDELDGERNVILAPSHLGGCVMQLFPTMWKTKINYGKTLTGYSVYDLFANKKFRDRLLSGFRRHFRRDSRYCYSRSVRCNDGLIAATTGAEWVRQFARYGEQFKDYDFWLSPADSSTRTGTGYTQIDASQFLWLAKHEVKRACADGYLSPGQVSNLSRRLESNKKYYIRLYKKDTRIFPQGFTAFEIGYIQVPANFPPLVAKYLCEKYTQHLSRQERITIYDPCMGWGSRITGAMLMDTCEHVHYVGTDPNSDNWGSYEYVADRAINATGNRNRTYDLFRVGAEDIHESPGFQRYKGEVDFVFTSPPYWIREGYSAGSTQSANKYPKYDDWRDYFLAVMLETCVRWLRPGGYLALNVADIKIGGKEYIPLENDSKDILERLGVNLIEVQKMVIANMPGAYRMRNGSPTAKNSCIVDGKIRKMEPIYIFHKPRGS